MKKNTGYTIVELLAVVTILVTVTGIIAALITQTLRGSSKTNITNQVAQVGNYAASVISNSIISAENVIAVNGKNVADCTGNPSPSGRSIELFISEKGGTILYECGKDEYGNDTISSNSASLIDTSRLKIDTSTCYFTCSQASIDPYTPPIITFGFILTQNSDDALFENRETAPFSTSVLMRNYRPN